MQQINQEMVEALSEFYHKENAVLLQKLLDDDYMRKRKMLSSILKKMWQNDTGGTFCRNECAHIAMVGRYRFDEPTKHQLSVSINRLMLDLQTTV